MSVQLPLPAVAATAAPLATCMLAAGYAGAHVLQNEEVEKRDSRAGQHALLRVRRTVQEVQGMLGGR